MSRNDSDADSDIDPNVEACRERDEAWNEWDDDEEGECRGLFSADVFPSASAALEHAATVHGFNAKAVKKDLTLDFYGWIRLVNFIRTQTAAGQDSATTIASIGKGAAFLSDDAFLKPVLEDDALLFGIDDSDDDDEGGLGVSDDIVDGKGPSESSIEDDPEALKQQVALLQLKVGELMGMVAEDGPVHKITVPMAPLEKGYFASYSDYNIHEEMLRDDVRTFAYRDSMYKNKAAFKDKIVLDVGCGTGILSMFAANAGAKHVIGVDMSDMLDNARKIVEQNGLSDKITLLKGKLEEVTLPYEKVDIIISEWMGYFLQYEAMLESVLTARDRYLVDGGLVLPDLSSMYIAGVESEPGHALTERLSFWNDVYGFKMDCMKNVVQKAFDDSIKDPSVTILPASTLVTNTHTFHHFNMTTMSHAELDFNSPFEIVVERDCVLSAFITHFDVTFSRGLENPVCMTTAPSAKPTHWKQTVFPLKEARAVTAGMKVTGRIACKRNAGHHRHLDIEVHYQFPGEDPVVQMFDLH